MAAIKIAYIGGGSTRAPGAMASFIHMGENFDGSEVSLIDLNPERLELVRDITRRMASARGLDITVTATTDRRAGLLDADAVLTSYRPGGFEARALDERIPLSHGVIGQETQGPGGLFMAFRAVHAFKDILADIEAVCPNTRIFNYTNPINLVSQAVCPHTDVPMVSLCEGPVIFPHEITVAMGLDPDLLDVVCVGINHASWSVVHRYDGRDAIEAVREAYHARTWNGELTGETHRLLRILDMMGSFPSGYFQYYFFERELARELAAKPTTRAQDILAQVPSYWRHYEAQAALPDPTLDPAQSRGGIHELELAFDAMEAVFNDRHATLPVNVPNNGAIPGFPDDLIVEVLGTCAADGVVPQPAPAPLPHHLAGIVESLAEYQIAAAQAAWDGTRVDGLRALAMHPFVRSLDVAEQIYDELAAAHRAHLPERLLA
jgi:6-phospho-beta-glucosidase